MKKAKYLIIGNGIAGLSAAKEIRKEDEIGSIIMVTSEAYLTYYRIKLTEYLSKDFKDDDLLVNKENWYEENKIEILLSKIVENLDIDNNKVMLDDGLEIEYEKLLLATGSRPFIPPIEGKFKKGVLALRTINDLKDIRTYIDDLEKVTVVGGGLLGLEAAWSLKKLGKKVTIVEFAPSLLSKQLDKEMGKKLEEILIEEGFDIYLDSAVEEVLGETKADGIRLNTGESIKTQAILLSVGIIPNIDIVRDTSIEFNRGIVVDNNLKTNIENVYVAGDAAEIDGRVDGLWSASNEQGKIAGLNMVEKPGEYIRSGLFTTLQLGDIKIFSVGSIEETHEIYEYKNQDESIHHKIFTTNGKVVGGILFGDIKDMGKLRKAVGENTDIETYLKNNLDYNAL